MNESVPNAEGMDCILVSNLELSSHISESDEKLGAAQRLTLNLRLVPSRPFFGLGDDTANTVDYFTLTRRVHALSSERPRKLIETLAEEIAGCIWWSLRSSRWTWSCVSTPSPTRILWRCA